MRTAAEDPCISSVGAISAFDTDWNAMEPRVRNAKLARSGRSHVPSPLRAASPPPTSRRQAPVTGLGALLTTKEPVRAISALERTRLFLIHGEDDRDTPLLRSQNLAHAKPDGETECVPGLGTARVPSPRGPHFESASSTSCSAPCPTPRRRGRLADGGFGTSGKPKKHRMVSFARDI
jgi:hypothetical protein